MPKSRTRERILNFIFTFKQQKDYAPTVKEIAENCNITSLSVVQYHLDHLERAGAITRERNKSRSINLVGTARHAHDVPLLGVIAAGRPIWVPDADTWGSVTNRVDVPGSMIQARQGVYALEVRGNSMVDAMIADGDVVIMHQTHDIKNGDVVAAWLKNEQEVTLKKIYFEGERVRLQPCNPFMMPLYQPTGNVEVQGKVIGVIRGTDPTKHSSVS